MTTITDYDLQQKISRRFVPSLESEQEIEIETDEVTINQTLHIDGDIEDTLESVKDVDQSIENLDDVDQATETLESLLVAMESSILKGGFDVDNAKLANITLESISMRFDLDPQCLNFGLEEVTADGEAETKSTIGKAKEMLTALKDNTAALIAKMYMHAAAALGNVQAMSDKILSHTSKIRDAIDMENPGTTILPLKASRARYLTINGTPLNPDDYVKEVKRSLDKYNEVVKIYSDTSLVEGFANDVITAMGKSDASPKAKGIILSAVRNLSNGITKPVKLGDGVVAFSSEPYLGNFCIVAKKPDPKSIINMLNEQLATKTVSQEGVGAYLGHAAVQGMGAVMYTVGQIGFIGGSIGALVVGGIPLTMLAISIAVAGYYGSRKGVDLLKSGFDGRSEEIKKAIAKFQGTIASTAKEASEVSTAFSFSSQDGISMEASKEYNVQALNPVQIKQVLALIDNTAMTTRNMKKSLDTRRGAMKQIHDLSKEIAKVEGNNNALSKAAASFVKQYIKQSVKFEMDMTNYGVKVMREAVNYIGLSNSKMIRDVITQMDLEAEAKKK